MNSNFPDNEQEIGGKITPFLDSVAQAYAAKFKDLSRFVFVFPNKRAGRFFLRALSRVYGIKNMVAPEVIAIQDFAENLSGRLLTGKIDLLFRLFNIYRRIRQSEKEEGRSSLGELPDDPVQAFEVFRKWGEVLVADFSEVDQYNVDAEALFKNVKDFKEISSNFLSEEQLEILQKYFGYAPSHADLERFWKNFNPPAKPSDIKDKFMYLWQMMAPLYSALQQELERDGLAMQGTLYRLALENVREHGREILDCDKVVFVGFNALSTTEALLFEELSRLGNLSGREEERFADFFWDAPGPVLGAQHADAASFLRLNMRNFPSPGWAEPWLEKNRVERMPELRVIAAPSNAAQSKIAAMRVGELYKEIGKDKIKDARAAVVLPDENLLLPLLYALPAELEKVNLTMGYPLKLTSVYTFMHHLRRLHSRARKVSGIYSFMREDLQLVLSHPFMHALLGVQNVAALNTHISRTHRMFVALSELLPVVSEDRRECLALLDFDTNGRDTHAAIDHLDRILNEVDASLGGFAGNGVVKSKLDRDHISVYRDALCLLRSAIEEHNVPLDMKGVFQFADKLLAGEHVRFEGEPLEGLQVMGMLETRALDFEHLVIPSLNDKVMPRKARRASFIPDSLRHGFGMPYANYQERLFSYYFYRMIARARTVTLIYDARSGEGMRSGGESRYLMQLRYLHARGKIKMENYRFVLNENKEVEQPVVKTPEVMRAIQPFTIPGSQRNFSASALKKYCQCPVKFYYEVIKGLKTDDPQGEYMSAATQGNIVHDVMMRMYLQEGEHKKFLTDRPVITREFIDNVAKTRLDHELVRAVNRNHFGMNEKKGDNLDTPLWGTTAMIASHLREQIMDILDYDRSIAPFEMVGAEIAGTMSWEYEPGKVVNMKYSVDRMDILNPGTEKETWRVVDYKTGKSKVEAKEFEDIFNASDDAANLQQLLLYSNVVARNHGVTADILPVIYQVGTIAKSGPVVPKVEGESINGYLADNPRFLERFNSNLTDIFNPSLPFAVADAPEKCKYCKLQPLCRRTLAAT